MDDDRDRDGIGSVGKDMAEGSQIGFGGIDESEDPLRLESHTRSVHGGDEHIDLTQDEYTSEEAARLVGTTIEVVNRAVYEGELKANRQGRDIICIQRADLLDWMRRRGPGV